VPAYDRKALSPGIVHIGVEDLIGHTKQSTWTIYCIGPRGTVGVSVASDSFQMMFVWSRLYARRTSCTQPWSAVWREWMHAWWSPFVITSSFPPILTRRLGGFPRLNAACEPDDHRSELFDRPWIGACARPSRRKVFGRGLSLTGAGWQSIRDAAFATSANHYVIGGT
jgi:hypothetical protein